ncbi:hypothetical protein LPJ61_000016 [Coemansia biformis]|uniref:Arrestin-like N-terminal domain-containing protein n=1 Tax=Coemansia biformis TaxID=1286918 RepID=A0A9W8CYG3_9FUNG|nr:hypothetical protein LPJ61_000016 [Coemansia biformis]
MTEPDPRIKAFKLDFPVRKPSTGLKPMRTYHGRVRVEVTEPVAVSQLRIQFEGWERIDFGGKIGATRKLIFRASEDLLQGGGSTAGTITSDTTFAFACTMPNVNFPSAMQSAICDISYTVTAELVGSACPPSSATSAAGVAGAAGADVPLAADSEQVQLIPRVIPSGVGWLKPMVMRDGVMLSEPVRRMFRRHTVQTAMNICVQVRNHCCTLGEAISVDVDATMLQKDRVLTFVRAAIVEQVALKTQVQDVQALESINAFLDSGRDRTETTSTVVLAERTLNRKVLEADPDSLAEKDAGDRAAAPTAHDQRLSVLDGVRSLRIRVPRSDVCTTEGHFLKFAHVLRLTFGLTSRHSSGRRDTKYATKDVPLRLVTSKFGDVGRMSQAEINRRLSALTTESDGSTVSEAYGYLLSENSRAMRPAPLESFTNADNMPAPSIVAVTDAAIRPSTPITRPLSSDAYAGTPTPLSPGAAPLRPQSSRSYFYGRRSGGSATPTPLTSLLLPQLVPGSTRFESKPLPPLPGEAAPRKQSAASPALSAAVLDDGSDDHAVSLRQSIDESVLYMVSRRSSSQCSDCDRAPNRNTLVDAQPAASAAAAFAASRTSVDSISTSGSAIPQRTPSATSLASFDDGGPRRDASPAAGSPVFVAESTQAPAKFMLSDKRGSAQSEGETIVSSPRSERADLASDTASAMSSPRKAARPELLELPAMESFSDMALGLLASSPVFGDRGELSSFWEGVRF